MLRPLSTISSCQRKKPGGVNVGRGAIELDDNDGEYDRDGDDNIIALNATQLRIASVLEERLDRDLEFQGNEPKRSRDDDAVVSLQIGDDSIILLKGHGKVLLSAGQKDLLKGKRIAALERMSQRHGRYQTVSSSSDEEEAMTKCAAIAVEPHTLLKNAQTAAELVMHKIAPIDLNPDEEQGGKAKQRRLRRERETARCRSILQP